MRKFLTTMTSMAMLLGSSIAYAQPIPTGDYGNGSDGAISITSSTFYADDQRAKVTGISSAVITVSNAQGGTITTGDYVLVIQMTGPGVGHYQFERVAVNSTANQYTLINNLTGFNTSYAVQVIHVYEFDNLTIGSGGVVTCAAWDGNTGGVVCFLDRGKMTITDNGRIDASEKGYAGGTGAVGAPAATPAGSFGTGGITVGGAATGSAISEVGSIGYGITDNVGTCPNPAHRGGAGTDQVPGGGASSGMPGTAMGNPSFPSNMIMGDGGDGGESGKSPGAGGNGGGGAGNGITSGLDGASGSAGSGFGGSGGDAGRGGGAIYIRAAAIDASGVAGRVCLFSNGGNGTAGTDGGTGGQGAPGGAGANGQCPDKPAGGYGGIGYRGDGGDGGKGGEGGDAGLIWVTHSASLIGFSSSNSFQAQGGTGGSGGAGGGVAPRIYVTQVANIMDLSAGACTYNQSGAFHYCDDTEEVEVCDCDEVFCRMIDMTNTPTGFHDFELDANNFGFWDNPGGGNPSFLYVHAITTVGGTSVKPALVRTTKYKCQVDDATAKTYISQVVSDLASGANTNTCNDNSTQIEVAFDNNVDVYNYEHDYSVNPNTYNIDENGGTQYPLNHLCTDDLVCAGDCPDDGLDGELGNDGDDAPTPQLADDLNINQETCTTCMVYKTKPGVDDPNKPQHVMTPAEETNSANDVMVNQLGVSLYPNPSSTVVNFSFNSLNKADVHIVITDALGKTVIEQNKEAGAGVNTFKVDISNLSAGIYIANIKSEGKLSQIKFIVQK